jgi:RNA polymerase sigma-70 factor (ECF subfamily)
MLDSADEVMSDFQIDLRLHQETIHQALETLSCKQRMALVLWAFHDMTAVEIGQVMELKKNAVDQLLWRAKNALREKLTER